MIMQTAHLETLLSVLKEGTFDAAAASLHVTPSAVSQRIKAMEQEAGRVLLQRTIPIRATEAGEAVVRYARQVELLSHDLDRGMGDVASAPSIAVAVNADSLATWFLPALAEAHASLGVVFDIHREDQEFTAPLLRSGTVVAAVTSQRAPVQGCSSTALGAMRYRAVATPAFRDRWITDGSLARLADAPVVHFDRRDDLQAEFLRRYVPSSTPPVHYVPTSEDFARAVKFGMGWGMLPAQQSDVELVRGELVELASSHPLDVHLYWQRWNLGSPLLDELSRIVTAHASRSLLAPLDR